MSVLRASVSARSSLACAPVPSARRLGPAGFTKSSTMGSGPGAPGRRFRALAFSQGNDLGRRFPFIAMAVAGLPATSCLIDGEEIVCDETGLAVFDLIRGHRPSATAVHCAFDLFELDGEDLRR